MTYKGTYYNEHDPDTAAWLEGLIATGSIPAGDVDPRDVRDVHPDDLKNYVQCHFFAGIGGWSAALRQVGWRDDRPVWTASLPCQPFSRAGKQQGFADERHLWPAFEKLIAARRPPVLFGEQSADASAWLSVVRGCLDSMDYAVGAVPFEAARLKDQVQATDWSGSSADTEKRGALHPEFVAWLMGYPAEWFGCAPTAKRMSTRASRRCADSEMLLI